LALLIGVVNFGLNFGIGFAFAIVRNAYLQGTAQILIATIIFIFSSATFVVFYFSARCKNENFDLDILAASVVQPPMKQL